MQLHAWANGRHTRVERTTNGQDWSMDDWMDEDDINHAMDDELLSTLPPLPAPSHLSALSNSSSQPLNRQRMLLRRHLLSDKGDASTSSIAAPPLFVLPGLEALLQQQQQQQAAQPSPAAADAAAQSSSSVAAAAAVPVPAAVSSRPIVSVSGGVSAGTGAVSSSHVGVPATVIPTSTGQSTAALPATTVTMSATPTTTQPIKRPRGRPKGSKNKPKVAGQQKGGATTQPTGTTKGQTQSEKTATEAAATTPAATPITATIVSTTGAEPVLAIVSPVLSPMSRSQVARSEHTPAALSLGPAASQPSVGQQTSMEGESVAPGTATATATPLATPATAPVGAVQTTPTKAQAPAKAKPRTRKERKQEAAKMRTLKEMEKEIFGMPVEGGKKQHATESAQQGQPSKVVESATKPMPSAAPLLAAAAPVIATAAQHTAPTTTVRASTAVPIAAMSTAVVGPPLAQPLTASSEPSSVCVAHAAAPSTAQPTATAATPAVARPESDMEGAEEPIQMAQPTAPMMPENEDEAAHLTDDGLPLHPAATVYSPMKSTAARQAAEASAILQRKQRQLARAKALIGRSSSRLAARVTKPRGVGTKRKTMATQVTTAATTGEATTSTDKPTDTSITQVVVLPIEAGTDVTPATVAAAREHHRTETTSTTGATATLTPVEAATPAILVAQPSAVHSSPPPAKKTRIVGSTAKTISTLPAAPVEASLATTAAQPPPSQLTATQTHAETTTTPVPTHIAVSTSQVHPVKESSQIPSVPASASVLGDVSTSAAAFASPCPSAPISIAPSSAQHPAAALVTRPPRRHAPLSKAAETFTLSSGEVLSLSQPIPVPNTTYGLEPEHKKKKRKRSKKKKQNQKKQQQQQPQQQQEQEQKQQHPIQEVASATDAAPPEPAMADTAQPSNLTEPLPLIIC